MTFSGIAWSLLDRDNICFMIPLIAYLPTCLSDCYYSFCILCIARCTSNVVFYYFCAHCQVRLSFVFSGFSSFEIWNKITSAQAATSIEVFQCKKHSIGGFLLAQISLLALS